MTVCANCHDLLTPGVKYTSISWQDSAKEWFCCGDCLLDHMAKQDIQWVNPNPQPDVNAQ